MRCASKVLAVLAGVTLASAVYADPPTELFLCGWTSPCIDWFPIRLLWLGCPGYPPYVLYPTAAVRQMWGPLNCVGPIEVSLQLSQTDVDTLPLFVEVRWGTAAAECRDEAGSVLWQTYGRLSCDPDSLWVTSPQLDLPRIVGLGNPYWLQLEGFARWSHQHEIEAESPYYNCIRVRSFPTAIAATSWTNVKGLYR